MLSVSLLDQVYRLVGFGGLGRALGRLLASLLQRLCPGSPLECLFNDFGSISSSFGSLFGDFLHAFSRFVELVDFATPLTRKRTFSRSGASALNTFLFSFGGLVLRCCFGCIFDDFRASWAARAPQMGLLGQPLGSV